MITSIGSFGPGSFILLQAHDLLMAFILVGPTTNEYIERTLTTSVNPITNLIFSQVKFPTFKIKNNHLTLYETNEEFSESGYYTRVSIHIYGTMML